MPAHARKLGLRLVDTHEPVGAWKEYARIQPGIYPAYCRWGKWYRDPGFKRWTCLLRFDIFTAGLDEVLATIPMWFNGGGGDSPRIGRRSMYLSAWVNANGGPPARRDRLSPIVFVHRMAKVRVADTKGPIPYSVVRTIVEWTTGQAVNQSHSQGRHE